MRDRIAELLARPGNHVRYHMRLWGKVDTSDPTVCWEWSRQVSDKAYGNFGLFGGTVPAHRVAYALYYGQNPASLFVCHRCDNRRCINPHHLFLGTQQDNLRDMVAKGRHPSQRRAA